MLSLKEESQILMCTQSLLQSERKTTDHRELKDLPSGGSQAFNFKPFRWVSSYKHDTYLLVMQCEHPIRARGKLSSFLSWQLQSPASTTLQVLPREDKTDQSRMLPLFAPYQPIHIAALSSWLVRIPASLCPSSPLLLTLLAFQKREENIEKVNIEKSIPQVFTYICRIFHHW